MSNNKREFRSGETVRRKKSSGSFSFNSDECATTLVPNDDENQQRSEMPHAIDRMPRQRRVTEGDINSCSIECAGHYRHAQSRDADQYVEQSFGPHRSHTTACMQQFSLTLPQTQSREQGHFTPDDRCRGNRITRQPFSRINTNEHFFPDNRTRPVKSYHETDVKSIDRRDSMPNLESSNRIFSPNETPLRKKNEVTPTFTSRERLNHNHEIPTTTCQKDGESNSDYERIPRGDKTASPKFYRRGFYIILIMNIIIMILNIVGLPFVYSNTSMSTEGSSKASLTLDSPPRMCVDCASLESHFKVDPVTSFGFSRDEENNCCLEENKMLMFLHKIMNKIKADAKNDIEIKSGQYNRTAFIQVTASNITKIGGKSILRWTVAKAKESLTLTDDDTAITVAVSGYYFVYSRVHYKKEVNKGDVEMSKVGHKLINKTGDRVLDSIEQNCYYASSRSDHAEHTSILESVLQLDKEDKIIITVDNDEFLQFKDSKLGMFLFSRR